MTSRHFTLLFALGALGSACGSGVTPTGDTPTRDAVVDAPSTDVVLPSDVAPVDSGRCPDGTLSCNGVCCEGGQACNGGFCCAAADLCGTVCCGPGRRCEANTCVRDCGTGGTRCGPAADETCCASGQVCYLEACVAPGAMCNELMRCPTDQYCETSLGRCLPRATGDACEYRPPTSGTFTPTEKWSWVGDAMVFPTHNQVMMTPVVANLDDDNEDGLINQNDIPDVVFMTFAGSAYSTDGILRILRGSDGNRSFPMMGADPGYRVVPGASIAIGDVDPGSPGPEIVTCSAGTNLPLIISARGTLLRTVMNVPCGYSAPAIADMNADGTPEIVVRNIAFHADGTIVPGFVSAPRVTGVRSDDDFPSIGDIDDDGEQEIILGNRVIRYDGSAVWTRTDLPPGYVAVADLNRDGAAEIVVTQVGTHSLTALNARTGATVWGPVDVNRPPMSASPSGGGPPTIADFNGDGTPDVASAGGYNYIVLNGATGVPLWTSVSQDTSSRVTGSSVFDFEGDGSAEVIYNDEQALRVYRGTDGTVVFSRCNTSGTLWEYPVIVDVDNDEHADIVVMENNYHGIQCIPSHTSMGMTRRTGIHVYSDPMASWVRTRRIWNQHAYHVTNVNEDGTIPRMEAQNWRTTGLNNFRQNVQPEGLFDAPDLLPADLRADAAMCPARVSLVARIVNRGRAGAPAGIPVTFYRRDAGGAMTRIGRAVTTRRLLPGESEIVSVNYDVPAGRSGESIDFFVIINAPDDMPLGILHECRSENNTSTPRTVVCNAPG